MTRSIETSKLSRRLRIRCKTLPGVKIENSCEAIEAQVRSSNPRIAILHLGTNNVASDTADEIFSKLLSVGDYVITSTSVKTLAFSSIIHRRGESNAETTRVDDVNRVLKLLANQRGWAFLENDNITPVSHLTDDGVHLNIWGTKLLAGNIIRFLRSTNPVPAMKGNARSSQNEDSSLNDNSSFRRSHQKFRRKPKGRIFPRDWLDSIQTARRLLN